MAKKGARSSGTGKGNARAKDQARAAHLPPAPATWNRRPMDWPYHNNAGARNRRNNKKDNN